METLRVDLMAYLFGDVLAVTQGDLLWILGGGALVLLALLSHVVAAARARTVSEELAQAEGVRRGGAASPSCCSWRSRSRSA